MSAMTERGGRLIYIPATPQAFACLYSSKGSDTLIKDEATVDTHEDAAQWIESRLDRIDAIGADLGLIGRGEWMLTADERASVCQLLRFGRPFHLEIHTPGTLNYIAAYPAR